jgi:tetratricopeptide (TPR) repeat protein
MVCLFLIHQVKATDQTVSGHYFFQTAKDSFLFDPETFCAYVDQGLSTFTSSDTTDDHWHGLALKSFCLAMDEQETKAQTLAGLVIKTRPDDAESKTYAYAALGYIEENNDRLQGASRYYLKALENAETVNAEIEIGQLSTAISYILYLLEYEDQAVEYAQKTLSIGEKLNHPKLMGSAWYRLHSIYVGEEDPEYIKKAKLYKHLYDSLTNELQLGEMIKISLMDSGWIHKDNGNFDSARYFYLKALALAREKFDTMDVVTCLGNLGEIALDLKSYGDAKEIFEELEKILPEYKDNMTALHPLYQLSRYENAIGNHEKAYQVLQKYITRDDIFYHEKTRNEVLDYEAKYEHLKQRTEIEKREVDLKQRTVQRNSALVGLGFLGSIGLMFFTWLKGKQRIKLLAQNHVLLETENQLLASRMKMMRAQMNPHFLFNSLNSIKHFILQKSKDQSAQYISDFSKLMRLNLQNSADLLIPLEREVAFLKQYLHMEQMRFKEPFRVVWEIEEAIDLDAYLFPPMLIQPYIENAIWHGLRYKKETGKIDIKIYRADDDQLVCIIQDDGVGRKKAGEIRSSSLSLKKSMGTRITEDRISMTNQVLNAKIKVRTDDLFDQKGRPAGTRVTIFIPYIHENN